jgi:proteic killer suppression protein
MPVHEKRLKIILQRLNAAIQAKDMNTPGMNFHELKGDLKSFYAVSVSGNWRSYLSLRTTMLICWIT